MAYLQEDSLGVAERKEREKQRRRDEILDAAEQVFFKRGFQSATVDDIAREAELSKGTVYLYFRSKELLYIGMSIRANKLLRKKFEEAVQKETTGLSRVSAIGLAYAQFASDYPRYFRVMSCLDNLDESSWMTVEGDPLTGQCQKTGEAIHQVIVAAIESGIDDGTIRADLDPLRTSFLLWSLSNGFLQMVRARSEQLKGMLPFELDDLFGDFQNFMEHALMARNDKDRG